MNLLITGATGLLGKKICLELFKKGHQLFVTSRSPDNVWKHIDVPVQALAWPLQSSDDEHLAQIDGVIHLMGESIASGRWTAQKKQTLFDSRVKSTQQLFEALSKVNSTLKAWVNASAIGFYGADSSKLYTENDPAGNDFLAKLGQEWEEAVFNSPFPNNPNLRRVALRVGVVLSTEGGALEKMLPAFENGVAGKLSNGKQWFSWIHIDDMVDLFIRPIEDSNMVGPYNAVAPEPIQNNTFTKTLSQVLRKPAIFPVPALALKIILGEMSTLLLDGHQVIPKKLEELGYTFKYPSLKSALEHLCSDYDQGVHQLQFHQWIPETTEKTFDFFCTAKNLNLITPESLNFKIISVSDDSLQSGTTLDYQIKIHGFPVKWKTLIQDWKPPHMFSDIQTRGPYSKWYHTHTFEPMHHGTMMTDTISYKIPLGPLGKLAEKLFVKKDLLNIFEYRKKVIYEYFKS